MTLSAITGYPRIGPRRELKRAVEGYWDGRVDRDALEETGRALRLEGWQRMRDAGIDLIPSNTFSHYDHVLDAIAMVGAVPPRYGDSGEGEVDAETYFAMARGAQREGLDVTAMEMIKWFDTNYHYIVPELSASHPLPPRLPQAAGRVPRGARGGHRDRAGAARPALAAAARQGRRRATATRIPASTGSRCCPPCSMSTSR